MWVPQLQVPKWGSFVGWNTLTPIEKAQGHLENMGSAGEGSSCLPVGVTLHVALSSRYIEKHVIHPGSFHLYDVCQLKQALLLQGHMATTAEAHKGVAWDI